MTGSFAHRPPRAQAPIERQPFHSWQSPDGSAWLTFYRSASGVVLRFPGLADFDVSADGVTIACTPVPGTGEDTVSHLFLNQVLPMAMSARGHMAFHASAVILGDHAVAFAGRTGQGKSTLAASFARDGSAFLTDDGLIVTEADGHYEVQPSHPSIRLWPDSEAALLAHRPEPVLANAATPKARFPAGGPLAHCASPRPLKAVFFLEDGGASHIAIAALQPAEALVRLLSNTFQLDIEDKAALRRHFAAAARLCGHVPGFRLDYPRRYDVLGSVRDAIAGTVSGR